MQIKKLVINLPGCLGDYWHNRKDWVLRDKRRIGVFKSYGYRVFIFWEHEIIDRKRVKARFSEEEIVSKIKRLDMFEDFKGKRHKE